MRSKGYATYNIFIEDNIISNISSSLYRQCSI